MSSILFLACTSILWLVVYLIFITSQFNVATSKLILNSALNNLLLIIVKGLYKLKVNLYFIFFNYSLVNLKLKFNRLFF